MCIRDRFDAVRSELVRGDVRLPNVCKCSGIRATALRANSPATVSTLPSRPPLLELQVSGADWQSPPLSDRPEIAAFALRQRVTFGSQFPTYRYTFVEPLWNASSSEMPSMSSKTAIPWSRLK